MADHDRLCRAFGLEVVTVSSSGMPDIEDDEEFQRSFQEVSLVLGDTLEKGAGSLRITSRRVVWISNDETSTGLAARFSNITLHAVSQANEVYPKACIYMQMEASTSEQGEGDSGDEEDAVDGSPELRLVPSDSAAVQDIFQVMCDSAAMNPDGDLEDEDGDEGFFYDEEAAAEGAGGDRESLLEHLDSLIQMPRADEFDHLIAEDPERFEDADADEEEEEDGPPNGVPRLQ